MADITERIKRQLRYFLFVGKGGHYVLQEYLKSQISRSSKPLEEIIKEKIRQQKDKEKKQLLTKIKDECNDTATVENWDISMLSQVIHLLFRDNDNEEELSVIRGIRDKRNNFYHAGKFGMKEDDFNDAWRDLSSLFHRLATEANLGKTVRDRLQAMDNWKRTQIADIESVNDSSDYIRHLKEYLLNTSLSADRSQKIKETIQILEHMTDTGYTFDIQLQIFLHVFSEKTQQALQDLFISIMNRVEREAGGMEDSQLAQVIQALKQMFSCDGANIVKKAIERCILIRIRCSTITGLLKLLRFVTSDAYNEMLLQMSHILSEHCSREVRITSSITEASMHHLLAFIDGSVKTNVVEQWTVCDEHPGMPIEYYCTRHDDTFCTKCKDSKHKSCSDVQLLKEMKDIKDGDGVPQMLTDLTNICKDINDTKSNLEREFSQLMEARERYESEIFAKKMELLEAVKKLERQQEECSRHYNKLEQEKGRIIETEIMSCETALKDIEILKTGLESSQSKSKDIQIIAYKKCKNKIPEKKVFVKKKQQKQDEIAIPVKELEYKMVPIQIGDTLQSLRDEKGPYKETHEAVLPSDLESKPAKTVTKPKKPSTSGKLVELTITKALSSKAESLAKVNVSFKEDVGPSAIFGCCVTSAGDILVADNTNKCLKRIKDNKVHDFVGLSGHPWDVCVTGSHNAAVAIFSDTLQFVNTKGNMSTDKPMKLSHNCRSLGFEKNSQRLVILDHSNVYLYTKSGIKERVLYETPSRQISLQRIAVSPSGKHYCLSTSDEGTSENSLIVIDNTGKQLKEAKLKDTVDGICYAPDLDMYVCLTDTESRVSVVRLNKQLKTNRKIKLGILKPKSLCFTDKRSELIIGQDNDTLAIVAV